MAILRIGAFTKGYAVPASFDNERELERVLAENLQLLVADGATPPVVVAQQLILRDAGRLDLLLLVDVARHEPADCTSQAHRRCRRAQTRSRSANQISGGTFECRRSMRGARQVSRIEWRYLLRADDRD